MSFQANILKKTCGVCDIVGYFAGFILQSGQVNDSGASIATSPASSQRAFRMSLDLSISHDLPKKPWAVGWPFICKYTMRNNSACPLHMFHIILLMEEILHQLIGSVSNYIYTGFYTSLVVVGDFFHQQHLLIPSRNKSLTHKEHQRHHHCCCSPPSDRGGFPLQKRGGNQPSKATCHPGSQEQRINSCSWEGSCKPTLGVRWWSEWIFFNNWKKVGKNPQCSLSKAKTTWSLSYLLIKISLKKPLLGEVFKIPSRALKNILHILNVNSGQILHMNVNSGQSPQNDLSQTHLS